MAPYALSDGGSSYVWSWLQTNVYCPQQPGTDWRLRRLGADGRQPERRPRLHDGKRLSRGFGLCLLRVFRYHRPPVARHSVKQKMAPRSTAPSAQAICASLRARRGHSVCAALGAAVFGLGSAISCSSSETGQTNASDSSVADTAPDTVPSAGDSGSTMDVSTAEGGMDSSPPEAAACDGGIDAGDSPCLFSVAVDGGISSFAAKSAGCVGLSAARMLQWVGAGRNGAQVNLTFRLDPSTPFTLGQTGTFQASLNVVEFDDSGTRSWDTPGSDCTFVIATSLVNSDRRLVTGSGSCSQAAVSTALPPDPAIGVGSFTFATTVE